MTYYKPTIFIIVFIICIVFFLQCKDSGTDDPNNPANGNTIPVVTTQAITSFGPSWIIAGGNITNNGGAETSEYGVCWNTQPNPTLTNQKFKIGTKKIGTFSTTIHQFLSNTHYYLRAYAINKVGTAYGNEVEFTTPVYYTQGGGVTDYDGNHYNSVIINGKEWMAENLKVKHQNNGTAIPYVSDSITWMNLTTPAYYYQKNDYATYGVVYGALYNWYAVGTTNLCPLGWHVADENDYTQLINFLNKTFAAQKLKESGTSHWASPNTGATNETHFTALPGGVRGESGKPIGLWGKWWTLNWKTTQEALSAYMTYQSNTLTLLANKKNIGMSVRCVKD